MGKDRGLVRIDGPDAKKFLQGQLTCDLEQVNNQEWRLGAHCNPQGRVISLFRIASNGNAYFLLLPREMLEIAIYALKKYAVFFKSAITEEKDFSKAPVPIVDDQQHKIEQIRAGIPDIYPATSGKYLPHELNLHEHGGVSLEKGCYTGQEIIARMHYRGKLKTHLYPITLHCGDLTPGEDVYLEKEIVGSIVDFCHSGYNENIALVLTDEESAKSEKLCVSKMK